MSSPQADTPAVRPLERASKVHPQALVSCAPFGSAFTSFQQTPSLCLLPVPLSKPTEKAMRLVLTNGAKEGLRTFPVSPRVPWIQAGATGVAATNPVFVRSLSEALRVQEKSEDPHLESGRSQGTSEGPGSRKCSSKEWSGQGATQGRNTFSGLFHP